MSRLLRPLTLYVVATILYLLAVALERGLVSTAVAMAGHALVLGAVVLIIHRRRHPAPQGSSGPAFTRTRVWRAFKVVYCIASPVLVFLAVRAYQGAQLNPYEYIDASGDVAAQLKDAREHLALIHEETRPVVQSMWLGLPLVTMSLFYAIRACVGYVVGRPDERSVHSRAA